MNEEPELYRPASDFLMLVLDEEAPLSGSPQGDANLALLIEFARDADKSNRDWAIFLLAQTEFDTAEIRAVFKHALDDEDEDVRAEALVGIAKRKPAFALPVVAVLLMSDWIGDLTLEAAGYVADPALLSALRKIRDDPENAEMDGMTRMYLDEALESCATGIQPEWRDFND
jgi:hypothetical protein